MPYDSNVHSFSFSPLRCIYRVPKRLRQGNDDEAYTPQVVSIGPLHHGKEHLNGMEYHKERYLKGFLSRTTKTLGVFKKKLQDQEVNLRSCYAEPIGYSSEEFLRIVLVDAAFIIEFLLRGNYPEFRDEGDHIFSRPWMYGDVLVDLQVLENQLPLFILEDLFVADKCFDSTNKPSIIRLSHAVFNTTFFWKERKYVLFEGDFFSEVKHFVDLIRTLCVPSKLKTDDGVHMVGFKSISTPSITELHRAGVKSISTPSITELHRAGVKLKAGSTNNLFDIQLADGRLEIPRLQINDHTEVLIRNLVAFEQCHYLKERYISDFVFLMDYFVNTPKDVELLVKHGIVENWLGDNSEVSTLINKLGKGVGINDEDFYFAAVADDLDIHCRTRWNKWMANLRQNYLNTPWTILSFVGAVFLLIFTFIQTVCSIISIS
ncbi:hypothetical protein ACE6H2_004774 [Prunus campanulata]